MRFPNWHHQDDELTEELRSHFAIAVQERMERGQSKAEAEAAVRREFGNELQVREATRQQWGWLWLEQLMQDLRYAGRLLVRTPMLTAVVVLTLALGIGANSAIFSIVYGVLLRPLPYPQADRVAMVFLHFSPQNAEFGTMSLADYFDWRSRNQSFEDPSIFTFGRFNLAGVPNPEQVSGASVTSGFFSTLRLKPLAGRFFAPGEDAPSSPHLAVLSEALWRRRFGSRKDVIGSATNINGEPATIIGVAPAQTHFPRAESELWTNLQLVPPTRRGPFFYRGIARLKAGVALGQAQAEMNAIARQIEHANPGTYSQLIMPVVPLHDAIVGNVRRALLVIFGAVLFVLLIGLVNIASLLLGRATARQREMAMRVSLGATRSRLWRQLLTESLLLGVCGGAIGIEAAWAGVRLFRSWNPSGLPRLDAVRLDVPVVIFTMVVSLVSGVLFGTIPALQSSRPNLNAALNEGGRNMSAARGRRARNALVVAEIALSLVLLVGGGLLLRSYLRLSRVDAGFQAPADQVLSLRISRTETKAEKAAVGIAFFERALDRVQHLPGVMTAAIADGLPPDQQADSDTFVIEGQPWTQDRFPSTTLVSVSSDYFRTLGIPLLRGRTFTKADREDSPWTVIISESVAQRYFPGEDPLGHHMKMSSPTLSRIPYMEIIGIVGDVKYTALDSTSAPALYQPFTQNYDSRTWLVVHSSIPPATLTRSIEREIHNIDPEVIVNRVNTLEQLMSDSVEQPRFRALLVGAFAMIALTLAAIGIFGVMSYSVAQRTGEIGVRMALGARRIDVLRMIFREAIALALLGIFFGTIGALVATRSMTKLLFDISSTDPTTFLGVGLLLAIVALIASLVPAHRATRIDPMNALRCE